MHSWNTLELFPLLDSGGLNLLLTHMWRWGGNDAECTLEVPQEKEGGRRAQKRQTSLAFLQPFGRQQTPQQGRGPSCRGSQASDVATSGCGLHICQGAALAVLELMWSLHYSKWCGVGGGERAWLQHLLNQCLEHASHITHQTSCVHHAISQNKCRVLSWFSSPAGAMTTTRALLR